MSTAIRDASREIEAARILREQIADLAGGDEAFIRDTLEGETRLDELIAALAADDAFDRSLVAGIDDLMAQLKARSERIERRVDLRRAAITSALEVALKRKMETPAGTISLKAVAPKVIVTEESEIPSRFFDPQPPKLSKTNLGSYLRDRLKAINEAMQIEDKTTRDARLDEINAAFPDIAGATLSNGSSTIQIKR